MRAAPLVLAALLLTGCSAGVAADPQARASSGVTSQLGHASVAELVSVLQAGGLPCEQQQLVNDPLAEEASTCVVAGQPVGLVHFVDAEQAAVFAQTVRRRALHGALAETWAATTPDVALAQRISDVLGPAEVV